MKMKKITKYMNLLQLITSLLTFISGPSRLIWFEIKESLLALTNGPPILNIPYAILLRPLDRLEIIKLKLILSCLSITFRLRSLVKLHMNAYLQLAIASPYLPKNFNID